MGNPREELGFSSLCKSVLFKTHLFQHEVNASHPRSCGWLVSGGPDRVCLLDEENDALPGTLRSSGDVIKSHQGNMVFVGRRDNQLKRNGKRLDLAEVEQVGDHDKPHRM